MPEFDEVGRDDRNPAVLAGFARQHAVDDQQRNARLCGEARHRRQRLIFDRRNDEHGRLPRKQVLDVGELLGRIGLGVGPHEVVAGVLPSLLHLLGVHHPPFVVHLRLREGDETLAGGNVGLRRGCDGERAKQSREIAFLIPFLLKAAALSGRVPSKADPIPLVRDRLADEPAFRWVRHPRYMARPGNR